MIYNFSHFITPDGRRVQFCALVTDIEPAARVLGVSWFERNARALGSSAEGEVVIVATPAEARQLSDALKSLGGDAVIAGRMLEEALDGMIDELRASRPAATRRTLRALPGRSDLRASA